VTDRRIELLRDADREEAWLLMVDGAEQSYVDLVEPAHLEFEYMQHMALTVDVVLPPPQPLTAWHLGGGACAFARWLAECRPGSEQTVVERSSDVLAAVSTLPPVDGCTVRHADALEAVQQGPAGAVDLVAWDVYDGPRASTESLTLDAVAAMRRLLRPPGGLLLLNVSDAPPFEVVRPVVAAARAVFTDVAMLAEPATLRSRRSGNCVVVGSLAPLPLPALTRAAAAAITRARVLAGTNLDTFVGDAQPGTDASPLPEPDEALGRGFL
jgi:spermidine synthase